MKQRERIFWIAVGRKGIGKSYQNIKSMNEYLKGDPAKGVKPGRVLVYDVNDEYQDIRAIALKDLALWCSQPFVQARRIRPFNPKTNLPATINDLQDMLQVVLRFCRNGMLLIEDMNRFTSDSMKQDLIGALCTNRHMGLDIVTSLQGIGAISPKMWRNANWLRLHDVSESIEKHKSKFEDKYEFLFIAQRIVQAKVRGGDMRFFVNVDLNMMRVYGAFTKEDFEEAATELINENMGTMITPKLRHMDMKTGKKKFTAVTAMQAEMKRLTDMYSQFTVPK